MHVIGEQITMLLADKAAHDEQINNKHMQYMVIFDTEHYNEITKTEEGENTKSLQ